VGLWLDLYDTGIMDKNIKKKCRKLSRCCEYGSGPADTIKCGEFNEVD